MREFYNKSGSVSVYGFACGYIESEAGVTLWQPSAGSAWAVSPAVPGGTVYGLTLTEARKVFRRMVREAK